MLLATSCIHLVSYLVPRSPLQNFLHASCFNIENFPHLCLSATSCTHAVSISKLPRLSNFLRSSCFRCLTFPLPPASLSPIFCGHLASISTCLFPPFFQHLLACILSQYLNSPRPVPFSSFLHSFGPKPSPCASQHFLHVSSLVSMSKLHLASLKNLLRSSRFNI